MNRFICFCTECKKLPKQGGDVIEMVRRFRRFAGPRDAAVEIQKLCGAGKADSNPPTQQEAASPSKPSGFSPLTYLHSLDTEHEALKELGILPETLVAFQAGYSSKGLLRGRLAVAWHDLAGEIKFFVGVSLKGDVPQYLLPKGTETPYWFSTHRLEDDAEVHIVPSILHVMEAFENGATNTIAPMRLIDADALTCLQSLCATKRLTVEL
jgi:hypothetical protein